MAPQKRSIFDDFRTIKPPQPTTPSRSIFDDFKELKPEEEEEEVKSTAPARKGIYQRFEEAALPHFDYQKDRLAIAPNPGLSRFDPNESLWTSVPKAGFRAIDEYTGGLGEGLINTGVDAYSQFRDVLKIPAGPLREMAIRRAQAKIGSSLIGVDYDSAEKSASEGNWAGVAGNVAVPAAMGVLMHQAGKVNMPKNMPIEPPAPKVKVVPQLTEFAGVNPYTASGELQAKLKRQQRADAIPKPTMPEGQFVNQASGIPDSAVRDGIFGPSNLSNETALLEQSRLRPQSRQPKPGSLPAVSNPVMPTPLADPNPQLGPVRPPDMMPNRLNRLGDLEQAPTPNLDHAPEIKERYNAWRAANSLADNAANFELFRRRNNIQVPPAPGSAVEIPKAMQAEPWNFDEPEVKEGPDSWSLPRDMGVQAVTPTRKSTSNPFGLTSRVSKENPLGLVDGRTAHGEVTGRPSPESGMTRKIKVKVTDPETGKKVTKVFDVPVNATPEIISAIIHKKISAEARPVNQGPSSMLYATVPERLWPEAPNVTRLRDMSEGYPKQGSIPIDRVQAAKKLGPTGPEAANSLVDRMSRTLDSGVEPQFKGPGIPRPREPFKSGQTFIDRNKLDVVSPADSPSLRGIGKKEKIWPKEPRKTVADIIAEKEAKAAKDKPKGLLNRLRDSAVYKGLYQPAGVSGTTELRRMGKAGTELADLIDNEITESNRHAGNRVVEVRQSRRNLSKAELREVSEIMDGQKSLGNASSQGVKDHVRLLREGTELSGNEAVDTGVRMRNSKGDPVPFQKHKGEYWPHFYDEALFKDLKSLESKLLKAGNSPEAVNAIMKNIREKGERFSPGQHTRDFNLAGYDMSMDALEKYHFNMSRAITRAKRFGPKDLADPNSRISQLIKETSDPKTAQKIVEDYLGRTEMKGGESARKIANFTSSAIANTKLSYQALTNLYDIGPAAVILGGRKTVKGFYKLLKDYQGSKDYATKSGALNFNIEGSLRDGGSRKYGKYFQAGAEGTENFVRTLEANVGRDTVQDAFAKAKKDPRWKPKLARFIDGDVESVLKQDSLTEKQLEFASGRAAELVSGLPSRMSLSKAFYADHPYVRLLTMLKRFSFLNTKNMVEAIKAEPTPAAKARKLMLLFGAGQLTGEAIGDAKAAIKGFLSGDVEAALAKRSESTKGYIEALDKIPGFNRAMANLLQSQLFGMPGDVAENVARKTFGPVTGTLAGPVGSEADKIMTATKDTVGNLKDDENKENDFSPLIKYGVGNLPYVGPGLAERFWPEKKKGNKFSESLGNAGSLGGLK